MTERELLLKLTGGLLALGVIVLCAGGCGLEVVPALDPPEFVETSQGDLWFKIGLDGDNDDVAGAIFRGVEYYYRFYPSGASVNGNILTWNQLISAGFSRLNSTTDTSTIQQKPLVDVTAEKGLGTVITLKIDVDTDPAPPDPAPPGWLTPPAPTGNNTRIYAVQTEAGGLQIDDLTTADYFPVRRGVFDIADGKYKAFDDFEIGDSDINHLSPVGDAYYDDARLALYAVCYGTTNELAPLYSEPLYLQFIELDVYVSIP